MLLACVGVCLAAFSVLSAPAAASANPTWLVTQIATAKDGTSRVLLTAQTDSGEVVSIWKLNAAGTHIATSQTFGPYTTTDGGQWVVDSIVPTMIVAADGTTRLLWTATSNGGTAASIWTFDSNMNKIGTGPAYGPYGDWLPAQFLVAPDGSERLLWTEVVGKNGETVASVWNLNSSGYANSMGASYGPFSGTLGPWTPLQMSVAPDGTARLLWINEASPKSTKGDQISFWTLSSTGSVMHYGKTFGPFANWWVDGFYISANDSNIHLLWYNDSNQTGDQASAWTLNTLGENYSAGPTYGPYTGWYAYDIFANPNGTSVIKWNQNQLDSNNNVDTIAVSFWTLGQSNQKTGNSPTYGPYNGWTLYDYERNASSLNFSLLWERSDYAFSTWSLNSSGTATAMGATYGPYTY